jgi:hypothetical protein
LVMVFNATFNNIPVIWWWSVLLVEETGVLRENHWPSANHWQFFSHKPYHFAMSVYFSAIKRDLAILTEWWQQCIAWWEQHSDIPRLQQVEQKAVGRQRNLGLVPCIQVFI